MQPITPGNPSLDGITRAAVAIQVYLPAILGATSLCIGGLTGVPRSIDLWRSRR